ncbi:hypothetical protein NL676_038726 [Syzygium grande]|nr:hypothetical protein NL676_038726 [Syzygium grande]
MIRNWTWDDEYEHKKKKDHKSEHSDPQDNQHKKVYLSEEQWVDQDWRMVLQLMNHMSMGPVLWWKELQHANDMCTREIEVLLMVLEV